MVQHRSDDWKIASFDGLAEFFGIRWIGLGFGWATAREHAGRAGC
jgi:hypothetical protein